MGIMKNLLIQSAKRLRRVSIYGLALLAGLVSAWAVREHVQKRVEALEAEARTPVVERLVAAYPLAAGTMLEDVHLAVREIPEQWAPSASVDPLAMSSLLGGILVADVGPGEPLLKTQLSFNAPKPALASRLQTGQRALTVSAADLGGLASQLRAGDLIDIYVTFPHRQRELTVPLLQSMRVLTVDDEADGDKGGMGVGTITLAADPAQAMKFVAARQAGTLTAMARHRDDVAAVAASKQTELASLIGLDPDPLPAPGVSILYGDRVDAHSAMPSSNAASRFRLESEQP